MASGTGMSPKLSYASSIRHRLNPRKPLQSSIKFLHYPTNHSSSSTLHRSFPLQASNTTNSSNSNDDDTQDDVSYLLKLGAGSVAGAAVIKYGSALFPVITQPNISLALAMISTPMIVAVFLLIKQSGNEQRN